MKNIPKTIFLHPGVDEDTTEDQLKELDFNSLDREYLTWSEGRVFDEDIEYVLKSEVDSDYSALDKQRFSLKYRLECEKENYENLQERSVKLSKEQDAAIGIMTRKNIELQKEIDRLHKEKIQLAFDGSEARVALIETAFFVTRQFEGDGMENMGVREHVIYDHCAKIIKDIPF